MKRTTLPRFPRTPPPPAPEALTAIGIGLRPAEARDLAALARLFVLLRMPELLLAPWSAEEKQAFANDQFRLQHTHFVQYFAKGDFWVITANGVDPVGRLYLDRRGSEWRLIELLLAPELRGRGIGSALIDWIKARAAASGAEGVALHVAVNNPRARALYHRLGFEDVAGGDGLNLPMRWRSAGPLC